MRALLIATGLALALAACGDSTNLPDAPQIQPDRSAILVNGLAGSQPTITPMFKNGGKQQLKISDVTITGTNANLFSQALDKTTVDSEQWASVQIVFAAPTTPGDYSAQLTIVSNAANSPSLVLPITGHAGAR